MSIYEDIDAEAGADHRAFMAAEGFAEEMDRRGDALADRDYYNSGQAAYDDMIEAMADEIDAPDFEGITDEDWLLLHPEAVRLVRNATGGAS